MKIVCRVDGRVTDGFLCSSCSAQLEQAFGDLPGLLEAAVDSLARQTRVYRSARRPGTPDEDWRGGDEALEAHVLPVDFDAAPLIARVRNTLSTWARHLAETRKVPIVTSTDLREGPTCPPHAHDFSVEGCGRRPDGCKQLHPGHVHDYTPKGCAHDRDPETGELTCEKMHCNHVSCAVIRKGEHIGDATALSRWMLTHRNAIRYDEAAADLHRDMLRLVEDLRRFVDRSPSPFFAGPCHARIVDEHGGRDKCQRDLYAWINPFRIDPGGKDRPTITCNGYRSPDPGDTGCGAVHTLPDRDEWLLASVDDALLPLATWQAALPRLFPALAWPNRKTWWRWVANEDEAKRRLFAKSIDRDGVELFRGGDIVELVRAEQNRIRRNEGKQLAS